MPDRDIAAGTLLSQIGRQFAAVLGATGAIGTLFYVGGVLTQNTYLWTLRAHWLSREIGAGDIFHGTFELLPSALLPPIAIVWTLRMKPSKRGMRLIGWGGSFFLAAGILAIACDRFLGGRLSWHAHSQLDLLAAILFSGAIGCVASVSLALSAADRSFSLPSAAAALVALMTLFVAIPFCLGRWRALGDLAAPRERLPLATIDRSKTFPVVATGAERVYCLLPHAEATMPSIAIFKWERVSAISPPAEEETP